MYVTLKHLTEGRENYKFIPMLGVVYFAE